MSLGPGGDGQQSSMFRQLVARIAAELRQLPDKPEETPDGTVRALWHAAAGEMMSVQRSAARPLPALDDLAITRLQNLVARRVAGEPLAHLTGRQQFMGLEMIAAKEALIPRRETEILCRESIAILRRAAVDGAEVLAVDVCTGSGNLALALAFHVPAARVFASDLSGEAVRLARRNAQHLGMDGRVDFREGDLLAPFDEPAFHGRVSLLVCNPPYISSKRVNDMPGEIIGFEPRLAFDGGPFGLRILERLVTESTRFLGRRGVLAFEVGAGQGPGIMKRLARKAQFGKVRAINDENDEIRAIVAEQPASYADDQY